MGLHVTPYGTFYVQRSLRTGEVMQVLPVRRPETPSHLPSVDSLGITDNFIERRRASLAANNARSTHSQDSLQRELASAGGERLLETGKAVLAQQDDGYGETAMEMDPSESPKSSDKGKSKSSSPHASHNRHHLNTDPHHPELVLSPQSTTTGQQVLTGHGWPEALPVNLPPFREIDSARVLSQDGLPYEVYEQYEPCEPYGADERTAAGPASAAASSSSRRHRSSSHQHHARTSRSNSTSTSSSMASQDSTSSFTTVGSTSSVSTAVLSPLAEHDGGCPAAISHHHHHHQRGTDRLPGHDRAGRDPATPSSVSAIPASSSSQNYSKTVWIIRTLQPRRPRPKRADGHANYDYDEQPRVETHVETHIQGGSDAGFV